MANTTQAFAEVIRQFQMEKTAQSDQMEALDAELEAFFSQKSDEEQRIACKHAKIMDRNIQIDAIIAELLAEKEKNTKCLRIIDCRKESINVSKAEKQESTRAAKAVCEARVTQLNVIIDGLTDKMATLLPIELAPRQPMIDEDDAEAFEAVLLCDD